MSTKRWSFVTLHAKAKRAKVKITFENGETFWIGKDGDIISCGPKRHWLPHPSLFSYVVTSVRERKVRKAEVTRRNRLALHEIGVEADEGARQLGMEDLMNISDSLSSTLSKMDKVPTIIPSSKLGLMDDCQILHYGLVRGESDERWMFYERVNGIPSSSWNPHLSYNNMYME